MSRSSFGRIPHPMLGAPGAAHQGVFRPAVQQAMGQAGMAPPPGPRPPPIQGAPIAPTSPPPAMQPPTMQPPAMPRPAMPPPTLGMGTPKQGMSGMPQVPITRGGPMSVY